jgi:ribosomal protein S7
MKKKKRYHQNCSMKGGARSAGARRSGKKRSAGNIDDATVSMIYRKYYKNQLAALYRAVKAD